MRYKVIYTQYYSYEVDADDAYNAESIAYNQFKNDPCLLSSDFDCVEVLPLLTLEDTKNE